ncbi:MAG: nodulation protein NodJ [Zetaproteobacteria bacterium CG12_big_fil_rev_8_21_14_0_65_54_13]|nr:MAG: nodulation protein NodJ [Zetaproteobacteria bacterium CG12_big_fil_rev_8_21_14_0_65_54_13]PIX55699.1 MAG: nodulation protein NodJ [Zetaproteobacteria bacterium CG_4_10_14_3_um_filter_54_28]PJA29344.1 MAG: nodulation protein NodJ [Zetaproteobacteria bacterium CG_4_9_14_3_um_filter_54_145]
MSALSLQPGHVLAVWRRNFLVWKQLAAASMLGNFGDPFLYLLGLGYGLGHYIGDMSGIPYMAYLASGILCSSAMNTATFEGLYSAFTRMNQQGTWESMLATPVRINEIIAGEQMWAASKSLISGTAIFIVAGLLGAIQQWDTALLALPVIFLIGLAFAGPALAFCAVSPSYDFFLYYFTLAITPMFLFCGVFYPLDTLPAAVQDFAQILPLTHAVALVRPLLTEMPLTEPWLHAGVLAAYAIGGFLLATRLATRRLLR